MTAAALRFMFNAMAPKPYMPDFPFQGIPGMLYMDCGPVSKSRVFQGYDNDSFIFRP